MAKSKAGIVSLIIVNIAFAAGMWTAVFCHMSYEFVSVYLLISWIGPITYVMFAKDKTTK